MSYRLPKVYIQDIFYVFFLLLMPCGVVFWMALGVLGPRDHPYFEKKKWENLEVHYTLFYSKDKDIQRTLTISQEDLESLKNFFQTEKSEGLSITHASSDMILTLEKGEKWRMRFSSPQKLWICKDDDTYYTYEVILSNPQFFKQLKERCRQHEEQFTLFVKLENIKLCRGYTKEELLRPLLETTSGNVELIPK